MESGAVLFITPNGTENYVVIVTMGLQGGGSVKVAAFH
jgi:hypothetical protein